MRTYKNKRDGFKEIQKRALRTSLPVIGLSLIFDIGIGYINSDSGQVNTLPFLILILLAAGGFGIYKGLNRQKQLFESYTLTIDEESIKREQLNTSPIKILKTEIKDIQQNKDGHITIRGRDKADLITITNQIDNLEELENELRTIAEIKLVSQKSTIERLKIPILLLGLISMGVVYISNNRYLVLTCGTFLTMGLMWSIYEVQTSKHIDTKTKRNSWLTIVVLISVVTVMYLKLVK